MQVISHNFVNVLQIPTKLSTEIHFNELLNCAKCQLNWSVRKCFMADYVKYVKQKEKMKKLK